MLFSRISLLLFLLFPLTLPASWDAAVAAYGEGEFEEAYEAFLQLRAPGRVSAALEYNLGNTALRLGWPDRALAHYRRALWITPGDPDLRANMATAQDMLGAEHQPLPMSRRVSAVLPGRVWRAGWFVSLWAVALFGLARLKFMKCRNATPWVAPLLGFVLLLFAWGLWASSPRPLRHEAVLLGPEVTARFEPHENATEHFALPGGSLVRVEETARGWTRVLAGERSGWVPSESLERLVP